MGKSSSSRRKRRSGASPPARMKKKTKSGGRTKSKKLRQRHDSESSSSDYDAQSMSSASFSSSGDEYQRRKRSRSPARTSTKGLDKKKSRRYSYSSESSEDLPPRKKRKGSRKDDDLGMKKKKYKKKRKHRARRSLSSSSRDYSTSEESEFERNSTRDRDEIKTRVAERTSSKSRHESRGCSPCGKDNLDGADHDERLAVANIPVRLKSVIVIVNSRDERSMELEEPKEEIVYDRDEYPSCRSNDSNDGGNKKELARDSKVDSKMENVETSSLGDERNTCSDVPLVPEVQNAADTSGIVDLELILRQRALENLKRLRGLSHKGKEVSSITRENNGEMKQSAATSAGSSQNALPKKVDSAKAANGEGSNVPNVRRNLTNTALVECKSGGTEGGSPKPLAIKAARQITGPGSFSQRVSSPSAGAFTVNSPRVNPFTWRRDSSVTNPVPKESQIPQSKPPVANLHVNKTNVKVAEPVVSPNKTGNDAGANKPSASKTPSLGDETASVKMKSLKNEAEDRLRRRVASMEPQLPQAKQVVAESEVSTNKHSHDVGPIQPCISASKDPSSRGLREMKSVNVEPKIVPQRRMIPTSKSHPHANKAVSKEGSVKLDESANKGTTAAEMDEPRGSASEEPSSSVVDEAAPGGEVKSEAAKDGTQYEQKTMTVVRGGEMIRVNYQVYIPKRAPALARRQLKR